LLHEEHRRRPLALHGQQGAAYHLLFTGELSSWRRAHGIIRTVCFLEKFLAIRIQRYQLQSDHSSRTAIPVEGILLSGISVDFWSRSGSFRGGAPDLGLIWQFEPDSFFIWSCYCTRFLLYFVYCKRYCSTSYIHHISKLVFPGGVLSRVM
jgi:hypothetical protein